MALNRQPNICNPDSFYDELIHAQRDLTDDQADTLLAKLAQRVVSLEIDEAIARHARTRLQAAGITNADVRVADATANGFAACAAEAPWNVILVSGSLAEVPQTLLNLLAPGGRLATITGHEPVMRATLVTRTGPKSFATTQPWDANAPRLSGFAQPSAFHF